jgi:SAM-dependent methyltransferase
MSTKNIIKDDCVVFNTIIDIGCANGLRLFPFEELGFKKLIGIDSSQTVDPKGNYLDYFCETRNIELTEEAINLYFAEGKFFFHNVSYDQYDFETENYSFILCYHFLHFIPDAEKYNLIERLYKLLEPGGIMYIKLNHSENKENIDPSKSKNIGAGVYEALNYPNEKRYLIEKNEFLSRINVYPQITKYFECDEKAITVVLKK